MFQILLLGIFILICTIVDSFHGLFLQRRASIFTGPQRIIPRNRHIISIQSTSNSNNIPKRGELSVSNAGRAIKVDWDAVVRAEESKLKQQRVQLKQNEAKSKKPRLLKKKNDNIQDISPIIKEPSGLDDDLIDEMLRDIDDEDSPILSSSDENSKVFISTQRKTIRKSKKTVELKAMDLFNQLKPYLASQSIASAMDESANQYIQQTFLSPLLRAKDPYNYVFASLQLYYQWLKNAKVNITESKSSSRKFIVGYVNQCLVDNYTIPATRCMDMLLIDRAAQLSDFTPGRTASAIHQAMQMMNHSSSATRSAVPSVNETLSKFKATIKDAIKANLGPTKKALLITIDDFNQIIRVLGKYRLIDEIFDLLEFLRQSSSTIAKYPTKLKPNDETYEFLANAVVANVQEDAKARAMKDLPKPDASMPEVILIGRSNVGKSSLVNFLVNRKALASTSATPGHTKQFHFFSVNKKRDDLPSFYLVDVPGLGYAEVTDNAIDSWRSLLERYLTVRESLALVLHLIDSRQGITDTDQQLIEIMSRAIDQRNKNNIQSIKYIPILTKVDQLPSSQSQQLIKQVSHEVNSKITPIQSAINVINAIPTSVKDKVGRDEVWDILRSVIMQS